MIRRVIEGSGMVPDYVEFRRCPKDPGHWKSEGDRCPVCHTKIEASLFIYAGVLDDDAEVPASTRKGERDAS